MSFAAWFYSIYGLIGIIGAYPLWVWLLDQQMSIDGFSTIMFGILALFVSILIWPLVAVIAFIVWICRLIGRTSKSRWWIPKKVRHKYY